MIMILGVAQRMFPRPAKDDQRYRPALAEAAYWMLTAGTAMRVAGELLRAGSEARWLRWAVFASGLVQVCGLLVFFVNMWPRIRGIGSTAREAAGERF